MSTRQVLQLAGRVAASCSLAAVLLAFAGCAVFSAEVPVRVVIPRPPEAWTQAFPDLWFLLVFRDGAGGSRTLRVPEGALELTIPCAKSGNSPVLAYPRSSLDGAQPGDVPGTLRPAGGLYPGSLGASRETPTLFLSWRDGPVAFLMSRLAEGGRDTALVNAARLSACVSQAEDPWSLDLEQIAQKLSDGDFSAYDVDALPVSNILVDTGPGRWFTESPFFGPPVAASQGRVGLRQVSYGLHYLFSLEGGLSKIQVGKEGTVAITLR
jgi:hypothetical protein